MTIKQIEAKKMRNATKYDVAAAIRKVLDEARKAYGTEDWDNDDMESSIIDLVTDEG